MAAPRLDLKGPNLGRKTSVARNSPLRPAASIKADSVSIVNYELPYDAILFDFDGVLADSEPVHFESWNHVLAPFGVQLDWETYARECIGVDDRVMIERLCGLRSPPVPFEDVWAGYPRKRDLFRELMRQPGVFHPETLQLARRLVEAQMPLAVVSSSGRLEVEEPLESAGILGCFQTLVCGREAERLKPDPAPYLLAAERLGCRQPLVVEDSDAGEASGLAAGFDVLRVTSAGEVARLVQARVGLARQ